MWTSICKKSQNLQFKKLEICKAQKFLCSRNIPLAKHKILLPEKNSTFTLIKTFSPQHLNILPHLFTNVLIKLTPAILQVFPASGQIKCNKCNQDVGIYNCAKVYEGHWHHFIKTSDVSFCNKPKYQFSNISYCYFMSGRRCNCIFCTRWLDLFKFDPWTSIEYLNIILQHRCITNTHPHTAMIITVNSRQIHSSMWVHTSYHQTEFFYSMIYDNSHTWLKHCFLMVMLTYRVQICLKILYSNFLFIQHVAEVVIWFGKNCYRSWNLCSKMSKMWSILLLDTVDTVW